jgi:sensor histidine kinase YesM
MFIALFTPEVLRKSAVIYLWSAISGILITHFYRNILKKSGWLELSLGAEILRIVTASLVLAIVQTLSVAAAYFIVRVPGSFKNLSWLPPAISIWIFTFVQWNAIYASVHYFRRTRRVELEKLKIEVVAKNAELSALLGQVNPHFLFNSLNSLRALIHEDPVRADHMVTELASVLRYSLQTGKARTVPLQTELDAVSAYLALEAIRFEERLQVTIEIPSEVRSAKIPPMLLQTLVENAIKHGIEPQSARGEVHIAGQRSGNRAVLEIRNTGRLRSSTNGIGIGLNNARERLRLLYGNSASLSLEEANGWVVATVEWPVTEAAHAGTDHR